MPLRLSEAASTVCSLAVYANRYLFPSLMIWGAQKPIVPKTVSPGVEDHAVGPGWSPVLQIGRFEQGEAQRLAVAGAGEVELAVFRIYCRVGIENLFPLRHFFFCDWQEVRLVIATGVMARARVRYDNDLTVMVCLYLFLFLLLQIYI